MPKRKSNPHHSPALRQQLTKRLMAGDSPTLLAKESMIPAQTLHSWRWKARKDGAKPSNGHHPKTFNEMRSEMVNFQVQSPAAAHVALKALELENAILRAQLERAVLMGYKPIDIMAGLAVKESIKP